MREALGKLVIHMGSHKISPLRPRSVQQCLLSPTLGCRNRLLFRTLIVCTQDVSGGKPVAVEGTDLPLWGMEIDPDEAKEEFRASLASDGGEGAKGFMQGMGLGMVVEQLADLKLGELLDTPPPGLDESVAIAKVCYCNRMYLSLGVRGGRGKGRVSDDLLVLETPALVRSLQLQSFATNVAW